MANRARLAGQTAERAWLREHSRRWAQTRIEAVGPRLTLREAEIQDRKAAYILACEIMAAAADRLWPAEG